MYLYKYTVFEAFAAKALPPPTQTNARKNVVATNRALRRQGSDPAEENVVIDCDSTPAFSKYMVGTSPCITCGRSAMPGRRQRWGAGPCVSTRLTFFFSSLVFAASRRDQDLVARWILALDGTSNRDVFKHRPGFVCNICLCTCLVVSVCSVKRLRPSARAQPNCLNVVGTHGLPCAPTLHVSTACSVACLP